MSDGRAIQFGTVALLTGVAAFFTVRIWGYGERLETGAVAEIGRKDLTGAVISSRGQLVGLRRGGLKLTVWAWGLDDAKLQNQRAIDLPPADGETPDNAPVAISPDAARIAWAAAGSVRVEDLFAAAPPRGAIRLERTRPLAGLTFADSTHLVLLYRDGQLEVRDLESKKVSASEKTAVTKPGPLLGRGGKLAVFSPSTGDIYSFDARPGRLSAVEYKRLTPPLLGVALSASGRIAALTERGVMQNDATCPAPGAVKAIAFDDDGRLLAVGDFEGVHALSPNQSPVRIAAAPAGTTIVAAGAERILFAGTVGSTLLSARTVSAINAVGIAAPSIWGLFVLVGLVRILAGRKKAAEEDASSPEPVRPSPPAHADRTPTPPDALVAACRSGDCVLFAGSGLASQAGLPAWEHLIRRLVYWAADQELVTREIRAACLAELDRGQSAIAADKFAAAFVGRERVLHKYLRSVFSSSGALSDTHDLLKEMSFSGVITSSFDGLIERTFPHLTGNTYTSIDYEALQSLDPSQEFFLLRLCGSLDRPETILFSPLQYAAAMAQNGACTAFLARALASRCVLFMGASLAGIESCLRNVVLNQAAKRKHFAVVDVEGEDWRGRAALLEKHYGITVLPFEPSDTNYPEVQRFLELLRDKKGTQVGRRSRSPLRESVASARLAPPAPATAAAAGPQMRLCPVCGVCYDQEVTVCPADQTATDTALQLERKVEGRYRLERLLGRGGMGAVLEATDLRLNRRVALKVVLSDVFRHANALQRFDREAKAAAKLNHANIISIYDYGVIGSRGAYLVMERLDGVTWRGELERQKRVPPTTVSEWADQLLEGVRAAHDAGIVHRDLKPENVFLAPAAKGVVQVKILDFGLAKVQVLSMAGEERLTKADSALGTFGYMPPEQLAGGRADESSDLYTVGIMVIESLTGLDPFEVYSHKDSLQTTLKDHFGVMAASEDIKRLSDVLSRSVAGAPRARYRSATEMQQDLIPALRRFPLVEGKEAGS